jgi:acetyl esterase/lipase
MRQANLVLSLAAVVALTGIPSTVRAEEKAVTYKVKAVKNIAYHTGDDQDRIKHKLDLYLPIGLKDFPVLFFVHGGAWVSGDKDFFGMYAVLANLYARQGIGVVVTNYRLSPAVQHPEHIRDVARAFAWTVKNIGKHGGRADRLFVCGHSAGGHLVALLTTDETYLKEQGLTTRAICAAIPISGVYRIPELFLDKVFGTDGEAKKKASPIVHARKGLPPFLILYADKDLPTCGKIPSEAFCKALTAKGTEAKTIECTDSDHIRIIISAGLANNKVSRAILDYIRQQSTR